MNTPETVSRMLHDIRDWNRALPNDTLATYTAKSPIARAIHSAHAATDLSARIAHTLDAENGGATSIRTPAQITSWAASWAASAGITYSADPLTALAHNTPALADTWNDWEAFAEDTVLLHTRIARITGHTPRIIGPCPACNDTVTQAQTRRGAEGPLECPRGHTYRDEDDYTAATRESDRAIARQVTDPSLWVAISQFLQIWPQITKDDVKNWTRTGRIVPSNTRPRTINLATANQLARQLTRKRARTA